MIIPTHCFSCGKPIGHLWFLYLEKVKNFQKEDRDKDAKAQIEPGLPKRTPEARALDSLLLHKYCCRRMLLSQPEDLVDMIRNRIEN